MKKSILFISLLTLVSCTSKTILEKPKDLIPKDTMVLLLTDLYIAKTAFHEKNLNNERKVNYTPLVYKKFKIDSTRFIKSNFYYTSKLDEYDLIFNEVKEKLIAKRKELEDKINADLKEKEN